MTAQSNHEPGSERDTQGQERLPRKHFIAQQQPPVPPATHGILQGRPDRGDEHGARRSSETSTDQKNHWDIEASSSSDESSALIIDEEAPESPRRKSSEDLSRHRNRSGHSWATKKDGSQAQRPGTPGHGRPLSDTEGGGKGRAHGSTKNSRCDHSAQWQIDWSAGTEGEDLTPWQQGSVPGTINPMDADDSDFY